MHELPAPPDHDEGRHFREVFDLREWARVFSAHIWWIAVVTAAVVLGTALTTFTATEYHRATQRILIERKSDKVLDVDTTYDTDGANEDFYLTQYNLLESRAVAQAALELLPAADRAWFARGGDAVSEFMRLIRIIPIRKSRLVDIHAEHPEPKVAEFMALAVMQAFVANNESRRQGSTASTVRKLREDARALKAKMLEARRVSEEFKATHGIVSVGDRQSLAEYRLKTLTNELAVIDRELSNSDSLLENARRAVHGAEFTTDLPEVLQSKFVAEFKLAYLDASAKLSQLKKKYKSKHPRIVEQQSRVDAMTKQINREVLAVFGSLQHDNDRLRRHKADVEARIERCNRALNDQNAQRVRSRYLDDEAESTKKVYEAVATRLEEVEVIEDYALSNVHAVGGPTVSRFPVRPRRLAALGIALLAGLILAGLLAFVLDAMDNSIKSSTEAEQHLGVKLLGMVPRVRGGHSHASIDKKAMDPDSNCAEAFRSIRTRLLLTERAKDLNSLVVTSTGPGEGKSLVALNVAAAFARAGHRVLLVDAEMRRPRLHEALDIHCKEGFSSVLLGDRTVDEVAFETTEDNLFFMPCGEVPKNPLELLTVGLNVRMRREMSERFDLVVFDSPPVGLVSDACILAAEVDEVLFVVRTFSADRVQSRRAVSGLRAVGATLGGLIVNHVDGKAERGRLLDFTYDSGYASMPAPLAAGAAEPAQGATVFDELDEDELDEQIQRLGLELTDAVRSLQRAEEGGEGSADTDSDEVAEDR